MMKMAFWPIVLVLLSLPYVSYAADYTEFEQHRDEFLRLEKQVWKTSDTEFATLLQSLNNYPLLPYLLEQKLLHKLRAKKAPQIRTFLEQYEGTVLENRVRRPWLRHLAKYNRKSLFLEFYRPIRDTRLRCRFLKYQLEEHKAKRASLSLDEILEQAKPLWNVGKSQDKECDPVFKALISSGQLTEDLVLQRIEKSAKGGQHSLIPYLKTLLPSDKAYLADLWRSVRQSPANVKHLSRFKGRYPNIEGDIASYALGRLIWRDTKLALHVFERAKQKLVFSNEQLAYISGRFAISLAVDDDEKAEQWLMKSESLDKDPEVLRWHMADLLREQDWASLINLIEKSPPELTAANEYRYWLARAYEQMGSDAKSLDLYQQLAQERHYYGFLASARLAQPVNLQNRPLSPEQSVIDSIKQFGSAKRAHELKALGRLHEARLEWRHLQSQLDEEQKLAASVIASEWGWHDQAIFGFSRNGYLNDVERRFPTAYKDIILKEAKRNKVEPEWAFAIARRESSFMPDAVSSADARGLMQLLPSTAKYLEKKRVNSRQLLNPKTNARLGNKYLRYLLNKLDNNTILATASYNAGWRRVKKWLPESQSLDVDLWIETIPYKETRNYVKAVMAYKQIYKETLQPSSTNDEPALPQVFNEIVNQQIPIAD